MIRKLENTDRQKIYDILVETNNFTDGEINVAMELVDIYIGDKEQKDYEIFVDAEDEVIKGYVCVGPRPLTAGTYDLYWIAVNPSVQSKGIGSGLISYIENYLIQKKVRLILIETSGKLSYEKERKFYEKNKYDKLVEIKDFYDIGDSLVIYGKYL
ncbi:MAG: GNAT family N-acetyltransferase [Ignavibacteriae bacterium]|jgi:GNAT superfamily N-acetyltransferase|nr:GNAT family N-acetyltransferase [Ignavibacteriota bacterium]